VVHRRAVAAIAFALFITSCGDAPITQSVLKAEPAARIVMPGSTLLGEVGGERVLTPTGPSPAFYGRIATTDESPEEVRAFFEREILSLGWVADAPPALGVAERAGWGWCKSRARFRLTIVDPVRLARTGIEFGRDLRATMYDATLIASERACPLPEATWPPSPTR
jgi:hypothetical protein